jgi:RNA polymerase sigma factor for flagellar operon FliA
MLPTVSPEDLMQAGRIALIRVARRFDPSRGTPFGGYLQQRLRGAMLDLLDVEYARFYSAPRDGPWDPALQRRVHLDSGEYLKSQREFAAGWHSLMDHAEDPGPTPEHIAAGARMAALIGRAADVLTEREKTILAALFVRGMTLEEAGKLVGLGESRVCQIRTEILLKLRERLRSLGVSSLPSALF